MLPTIGNFLGGQVGLTGLPISMVSSCNDTIRGQDAYLLYLPQKLCKEVLNCECRATALQEHGRQCLVLYSLARWKISMFYMLLPRKGLRRASWLF